jgi:hypothetical protein
MITRGNGKTKITCDLCEVTAVWVVGSPRYLLPAGWVCCGVGVAGIFLICPTCQIVARALQTVDVERSQSDGAGNPDEAKT